MTLGNGEYRIASESGSDVDNMPSLEDATDNEVLDPTNVAIVIRHTLSTQ